jgi:Fuc2NAc and GlcNAc transferase
MAPGWLGRVLATLYVIWILNLTNFMDGIDGLAAVEVVTVSLGGALLYLVAAPGEMLWILPVALAMATLGFLMWNWPPASIFMGDVGSGFLGLMMAALSLQAAQAAPQLFWAWVILLGVFIVDATVTLGRRLLRGEPVYLAHRMHAYQHATAWWGAHQPVTCVVGAINVLWLLPFALLVAANRIDGVIGVVAAYVPLVAAALWLGAGRPGAFRARPSDAHV